MKKLFNKSTVALTMALVLVLSMVSSVFAAGKSFSDINGHWAQGVVEKWANTEYIPGDYYAKGYPNGTFQPDNIVTRAEFCAFANRYFGYFEYSKDIKDRGVLAPFSDVANDAWYYHDVAVANAVGYATGYANGTFQPDKPMSREEVAFALGKLFGANLVKQVEGVAGTIDNTIGSVVSVVGLDGKLLNIDITGVIPQLKPIVKALLENHIVSGVLDTVTGLISFVPNRPVTRAEIVKIMDNIFIQFPELLNNGNLLTTVLDLVGGLTGTVVGTVGGLLNTVTGVLDGLTGAGGAVAQDPGLLNNTDGLLGTVTGLLGGVLGGLGGLGK